MRAKITAETPLALPWRIVIDTAEQHAFSFTGLKSDAAKLYRPIQVECVRRCLGRHPHSRGDYSIEDMDPNQRGWETQESWCFIERKSLEDCQSTLLGYSDGHRDRFESELSNLASVIQAGGAALVVVECDMPTLLSAAVPGSRKPPQVVARSLHRTICSMWREHGVPWAFCGSRRLAEVTTFRFLESFWKHRKEGRIEDAT